MTAATVVLSSQRVCDVRKYKGYRVRIVVPTGVILGISERWRTRCSEQDADGRHRYTQVVVLIVVH